MDFSIEVHKAPWRPHRAEVRRLVNRVTVRNIVGEHGGVEVAVDGTTRIIEGPRRYPEVFPEPLVAILPRLLLDCVLPALRTVVVDAEKVVLEAREQEYAIFLEDRVWDLYVGSPHIDVADAFDERGGQTLLLQVHPGARVGV